MAGADPVPRPQAGLTFAERGGAGRGAGRCPKASRHRRTGPASVRGMNLQLSLIELVVADMAATLAFYRRLGLDIPPGAEEQPHVDIELKGGLRMAFDTEDTIRSFDKGWTRPSGGLALGPVSHIPHELQADAPACR